jgi:N-methylhydantoinase A
MKFIALTKKQPRNYVMKFAEVQQMYKISCVDIGGTFTDVAVLDQKGGMHIFKSPTTPEDYAKGMLNAFQNAAEHYGISREELLREISLPNGGRLTHGSTIATNAMLEKKAGKVGVITTKGFRDVLLFREGPAKNPHDLYLDYPEPFIPRYLVIGVEERVDAEGGIVIPLNERETLEAVKQLVDYHVEAIAVCFLWSPVNAIHEQKARKIAVDAFPEIPVVISSEVNPQINEYRRFVSAAMDASLRKLVSIYARKLNDALREQGFIGEIGMLSAYGGVMSTEEISKAPLLSIDSGPAMAPVAGRMHANQDLGESSVVVLDMGGTTFDVSCVIDNHIGISKETIIGDEIPGIARVGVHSIGAGGGSLAWVDVGGMLRIGPQSAGSVPGPACYQRGGAEPTVTDANVVLGYINPDFFNGGKMKLDVGAAKNAIQSAVADSLGIDLYEAAYAIWGTVNANMVKAIKDVTVWQGVDPREYTMVAGGGACGLHAVALAEGLEMKKLLIPKTAGGLSATGGVFSDLVKEFFTVCYQETRTFDYASIQKVITELYEQGQEFLVSNNIAETNRRIELYVEGRYPSQAWDLMVRLKDDLEENLEINEGFVSELENAFHAEHLRQFAVKDNSYVNCFAWRIRAIGRHRSEIRLSNSENKAGFLQEQGKREMFFKEAGGMISTRVYNGASLSYGHRVVGPAVVEEPTTVIVVPPNHTLTVTKCGNYYFDLEQNISKRCDL